MAQEVDVVVVGAGMGGLYLLKRLRDLGFTSRVFETGHDVGGTWYWNRYPGARVDIPSIDYQFSWDPDLEHEWTWTEKYSPQPELLRYLGFVADKHDLRSGITFNTRVESAVWDDDASRWTITTSGGETVSARHYVMATGCLSVPKDVDIEGADSFQGPTYFTSRWPHDGVDFTGMRVAVIGTGSSAIQSIPEIAKQAAQLTVFQRTPNFSMPANNGPDVPAYKTELMEQIGRDTYRDQARWSNAGVPVEVATQSALAVSDEERTAKYEWAWNNGGIVELIGTFMDHLASAEANAKLAEFIHGKIREIVKDPATADALCPTTYPVGSKRLCVDTNYYATYNLPHVRLVDLRQHPIARITATGVDLVDESLEFDAIVFATGFDAMTGAMVSVDITGRDGLTLKQAWEAGPLTYLGLMSEGFPNLFMITGPGSPSVLSNMVVSIEQHVDWVADTLARLRNDGFDTIEPTHDAVEGWVEHVNGFADLTLMPQANSWYLGANVPGKPRVFLPYAGGVGRYRRICTQVVERDYLGFERRGPQGVRRTDGRAVRLQPDVLVLVETMAELNLPPIESMSPAEARGFMEASAAMSPPGPEVGEVVDGTLPGADGTPLAYRLYRPAGDGPHPVVAYFHGGGWVLGHATSDDAFCRDLCVRTGAVIVSVDYRHAPEARFPAAADDAIAATAWIAEHAADLGGIPGQLAVAGWSAGGNLAAVVAQQARDAGGPTIVAQLLLTPVTDSDQTRTSYVDNGEGYVLTAGLMRWFWDHYVDEAHRSDPKVAPLRAASLAGLPPAVVVTAEFDPLRDEGDAYAEALAAAGVPVTHIRAAGHTHTSLTAVGAIVTGEPVREQMAAALRGLFGAAVPA